MRPTKNDLAIIEHWDVLKTGVKPLVEYATQRWMFGCDWYRIYKAKDFASRKKTVYKLELHTAGCSGNEQIICALQKNLIFQLGWWKSARGGHHWYEFSKDLWEGKNE